MEFKHSQPNEVHDHNEQLVCVKYCRVCSDIALGFNFDGLCCESCKAFFRRNAPSSKVFKCRKDGNCVLTKENRKFCKKCRLERCYQIGMKKELIWSVKEQENRKQNAESICADSSYLKVYDYERIREVQEAMSIFKDETKLELVGQAVDFTQIVNLNQFYVKWTVKYCKTFEAFRILSQHDQIVLLKLFHQEKTVIGAGYNYNAKQDGFSVLADYSGEKAVFVKLDFAELQMTNFVDRFRKYITNMKALMDNDPVIRDLLTALILFKPRHNITCEEFLRYNHHLYGYLLRRYLNFKYRNQQKAERKYFALQEMLNKVNEICDIFRTVYMNVTAFGVSQVSQIIMEVYTI